MEFRHIFFVFFHGTQSIAFFGNGDAFGGTVFQIEFFLNGHDAFGQIFGQIMNGVVCFGRFFAADQTQNEQTKRFKRQNEIKETFLQERERYSQSQSASEHGKDKNDRQDDGLRIREVSKRYIRH